MKKFFPVGGRQLLDGGLNNKYAVSIIENNESPDCLNVVFTAGAAETRQGIKKLNTTAVGTFACDGIYTYRNNTNAETMCAWFGGTMYALSGTTFYTTPSAQSVFTAGVRVGSEQAENYIFFGNGNVTPYKYNGAFTRHGVPAPTQTATVVSAGTVGALTASGNYLYAYTYVNSGLVEGNISPISTTFVISSTSGQNTISNFATAPVSHGVNNIYLYRTKANTTTPYYRVTTFTNGTSSYTDNIADSALAIQAPTDNGEPPKYNSIVYAQGRLFCNDTTNPNFVFYSNLATPYTFGSQNFVRVGDNSSDLVKGLAYYGNSIIIFCEKSVWFLYLTDASPTTWVGPIKSNSPFGSKSPFGLVNYNNKLLFPAIQNNNFVGFAALSGNVIDTSRTFLTVNTAGSDLKSDPIEADMAQAQSAYLQNISSIVYKKKAWISVTYGANNTTNNRVYYMDFSMSNLSKDQEIAWSPFSGMNAAQFTIYNGSLYFGSSTANGFVYQTESGLYHDDGVAINSYYWTKEYVGEESDVEGSDTSLTKDFRYVSMLVDNAGAYSMNFTYKVDSDKGAGTAIPVSVDPGSTLWGSFIWGVGSWGGGKDQDEKRIYLANARGRRIQFKFDNQNVAGQRFKVHGFNFLYNIKGYR